MRLYFLCTGMTVASLYAAPKLEFSVLWRRQLILSKFVKFYTTVKFYVRNLLSLCDFMLGIFL